MSNENNLKQQTLHKIYDELVSKNYKNVSETDMVGLSLATGCVFSLLRKSGNNIVRKLTTVPSPTGQYQVGSKLSTSSDAYKALRKGNSFEGNVELFGRSYNAVYFPIKSNYYGFIGMPL